MKAEVSNSFNHHHLDVETKGVTKFITIAPKADGFGSAISGGELLLSALATCFCNGLYREANKRNITVNSVKVTCSADFLAVGEPGSNFTYHAVVDALASPAEISELIAATDKVAEVHNTLRQGVEVRLTNH